MNASRGVVVGRASDDEDNQLLTSGIGTAIEGEIQSVEINLSADWIPRQEVASQERRQLREKERAAR